MRRLLLSILLLYPASLFAVTHQAFVVSNGSAAYLPSRPATATFSANTNFRIVIRFHNCTSGGGLFTGDPFYIRTDCASVSYTSGVDGSGATGASFPAGASDIVAQIQRINGGTQLCVELWRTDTGAYNYGCSNPAFPSGAQNLDGGNLWIGGGYVGGLSADIDYVRWYSTTVPLGTIPSTAAGGDMADWEFDGNGNDSSASGMNLSMPGGVSYVTTPLYGPLIAFPSTSNCFINNSSSPQFCVYSAGHPSATPLNTTAYSPNQGDSITYSWSQIDGPITGTIASPTSQNTTVTGLSQFGQYDFGLTVTDTESNHATGTLRLGIVTVGNSAANNCIVSDVPSNLQYLIGPLTPALSGSPCSPWPWYDTAEIANVNVLMSEFEVPPSSTRAANPGTISISGTSVTGTGTHFTSDCPVALSTLSGSTTSPPSCNGATIWVWWNAEGGTGNGRYEAVMTVIDDTHATLDTYRAPGTSSGLQYSYLNYYELGIPFANAQNGVGGSYNWNYYDNVIGVYRLYYRTGITAYLNYAHTLADAWWTYALDHGYSPSPATPRLLGIPGMMARAIEGGFTQRWAGIENKVGIADQGFSGMVENGDPREAGYAETYFGLLTVLDPNITGNPTNQSNYCGYVASSITNMWTPWLSRDNGLPLQWLFNVNPSYPSIGLSVFPYQFSVFISGLRDAYRALNSSKCSNPSAAATVKGYITSLTNSFYLNGQAGYRSIPIANGGGTGRVGAEFGIGPVAFTNSEQAWPTYVASGENASANCNLSYGDGYNYGNATRGGSGDPTHCIQGTVSGTLGSTTLTGSGTHFTTQFACNGTDGVGLVNSSNGVGTETHKVVSCASDTSMTLSEPLLNTFSGWYHDWVLLDTFTSANCAPSRSAYCYSNSPSPGTSPDYSTDNAGIFGWTYNLTGQLNYKIWGDDLMGLAYGGPAGGPGTSGQPAGPFASGQTTSAYGYISALPSCSQATPPCGGVGAGTDVTGTHPVHWGKDYGIGSGWVGAIDNYLAYRLLIPGQN